MLLPQPDSPTRQSVRPGCSVNDTSRTTSNGRSQASNRTVAPSACNSGAEEAGIGADAFAERDMGRSEESCE